MDILLLSNFISKTKINIASSVLTYEEAKSLTTSNDPSTSGYYFQQTMYRIKDPKASLKFYGQILGMNLLAKVDFPEMEFSLYFLGYENVTEIPSGDIDEKMKWALSKKGTLELTHNWGTESSANFSYHNGNSDPQGYGHIGIVVPDVEQACERFGKHNVEFVKKPHDGKIKGIAFVKDPDGYWIEIISKDESDSLASAQTDYKPSEWSPGITYEEAKSLMSSKDSSSAGFTFHQTRYRIKDPKKSLKFYNQVLGMSLLDKIDSARMNFSLYFLGYENTNETSSTTDSDNTTKLMNTNNQGGLELMHDWTYHRHKYYRTTSIEMRYYADPRDVPHITIIVPSLAEACERFDRYKVPFVGERNASINFGMVFIKDPDAYAIEIVEKSFL